MVITITDVGVYKDGQVRVMDFNGATSAIGITSALLNSLSSTIIGSFAAWIKTYDITATQEIVSFGDTNVDTKIQWDIDGTGRLRALVGVSGVTKWALDTDDVVFTNGIWAHIALTTDGADPVLYVNGIAVAQAFSTSTDKTFWFSQMSGLDNGRIGCGNWNSAGNATFFKGLVNDIRIDIGVWTAQEVSQIFSSERHLYNV